jgi:hypothetical protein
LIAQLQTTVDNCDLLHYSTTLQIFEQRKYDVLTNWSLPVWAPKVYHALQEFKDYFIKQWLVGDFCNWQIFNTPPGYATTQNPEESFNKQIKVYTEFERLTVLGACQAMHNICSDYSHNMGEFKLGRDKDNATIKLAECSPKDFYKVEENQYWYKEIYQIFLEPRFCSCQFFTD